MISLERTPSSRPHGEKSLAIDAGADGAVVIILASVAHSRVGLGDLFRNGRRARYSFLGGVQIPGPEVLSTMGPQARSCNARNLLKGERSTKQTGNHLHQLALVHLPVDAKRHLTTDQFRRRKNRITMKYADENVCF